MIAGDCADYVRYAKGEPTHFYVRHEAEADMEASLRHAKLPASHSLSFDHRRLPP
ncbi:hypothetical protein Gain_0238_002 [Komagataeibacter intermedius TF2]|nr:hypothetical protein Gain_0238_002 [Komagataeibacter intermedius TF2]